MGRQAVVVAVEDVMERLGQARFRTTVQYTGPLAHEYIMSHWEFDYRGLWRDMRELIATQGVVRPFFKSKQVWKYVDLPDGFTYWVMPECVLPNWEYNVKANQPQVLNRQRTDRHFHTGAQ